MDAEKDKPPLISDTKTHINIDKSHIPAIRDGDSLGVGQGGFIQGLYLSSGWNVPVSIRRLAFLVDYRGSGR